MLWKFSFIPSLLGSFLFFFFLIRNECQILSKIFLCSYCFLSLFCWYDELHWYLNVKPALHSCAQLYLVMIQHPFHMLLDLFESTLRKSSNLCSWKRLVYNFILSFLFSCLVSTSEYCWFHKIRWFFLILYILEDFVCYWYYFLLNKYVSWWKMSRYLSEFVEKKFFLTWQQLKYQKPFITWGKLSITIILLWDILRAD